MTVVTSPLGKCSGTYSADYLFGHSKWSQQDFNIGCVKGSSLCWIKSPFHGHFGQVYFAKEALPEWKEYDGHAHTFINKYVVRDNAKGKSGGWRSSCGANADGHVFQK